MDSHTSPNASSAYDPDDVDPLNLAGTLSGGFHTAVACLLSVGAVLAVTANGIVLAVFLNNRHLISTTNMFVIALAVSDLSEAVLGNPFIAASSIAGRWIFGRAGCLWYGFIMTFLGLNSIALLVAISLDRFIVMAKPLLTPYITPRRALVTIVCCALYALFWAVAPLLGWSAYDLETPYTSCSIRWQSREPKDVSYCVCLFIFCFFIPLIIIGYSYFNIYGTVFRSTRVGAWAGNDNIKRKNKKVERQVVKITVSVTVSYMVSWTPYAVVSAVAAFGNPDDVSAVAGAIPALLAKSAIVFNPIIYTLMNPRFRNSAFELVPCKKIREYLVRNTKDTERGASNPDENSNGINQASQSAGSSRFARDKLQEAEVTNLSKRAWMTNSSASYSRRTTPIENSMHTETTSCHPLEITVQEPNAKSGHLKTKQDSTIVEEIQDEYV